MKQMKERKQRKVTILVANLYFHALAMDVISQNLTLVIISRKKSSTENCKIYSTLIGFQGKSTIASYRRKKDKLVTIEVKLDLLIVIMELSNIFLN